MRDCQAGRDGVDAFRADAMQRREMLASGEKLQGNFKPQSRAIYVADARAQLDWAATTDAGFRERLVWFWSNHFTVSVYQGGTAALAGAFVREAIRPHVTGNFTDMVLAAERHPAMLRYLNNDASVGPDSVIGQRKNLGLNENLGRECMELHTVGLAAGYSQADVTSMANILTGWSIAGSPKGDDTGFKYRPLAHEPGVQTVMGAAFRWRRGGRGVAALTFSVAAAKYVSVAGAKVGDPFCGGRTAGGGGAEPGRGADGNRGRSGGGYRRRWWSLPLGNAPSGKAPENDQAAPAPPAAVSVPLTRWRITQRRTTRCRLATRHFGRVRHVG